ncbi:MAG: sec-independent protein translocase protein TatA [Saprospiraceae bacterium]|jgi:sec-independent protein translocase protein TatA
MMVNLLILGMISGPQIMWVVIAILVLFGGKKIPELMKGLGKGIKEFKDASKNEDGDKDVSETKEK